jgi:hypothetical protein
MKKVNFKVNHIVELDKFVGIIGVYSDLARAARQKKKEKARTRTLSRLLVTAGRTSPTFRSTITPPISRKHFLDLSSGARARITTLQTREERISETDPWARQRKNIPDRPSGLRMRQK